MQGILDGTGVEEFSFAEGDLLMLLSAQCMAVGTVLVPWVAR